VAAAKTFVSIVTLAFAAIASETFPVLNPGQFGQLGDGTTTERTTPAPVAGGLAFVAVSAGANHTCGVTAFGTYCWGSNSNGQLGDGSTTDGSVPVKVAGHRNSVATVPRLASPGTRRGGGGVRI